MIWLFKIKHNLMKYIEVKVNLWKNIKKQQEQE